MPIHAELTSQLFSLPVISRASLQNQAKDAIVHAILNGLFMPGERVVETKVADGLRLSRSTVRAAIQALVQEGLLQQEQFKGTIVMPLTARGAQELESMREALEGLAVRLAVEHATAEEIEELKRRYQAALAASKKKDLARSYHLDLALHQQIVQMAHHELLAGYFKQLEPKMLLYMVHAGGRIVSAETFRRQHEDVVEAIVARDFDRAKRALDLHFEEATDLLVELFSKRELSNA